MMKKFCLGSLLFYYFYSLVIFLLSSFANSNEIYVISKVNNQIITNADVNKEYKYLIALNPNLQSVEKKI